mmetsp:Transcript_9542/g.17970  ORF Transcript_9542/g.17970 Transcript_9542/m.17970 type:complete len:273 (+) Transcript_9542:761-1579(+)
MKWGRARPPAQPLRLHLGLGAGCGGLRLLGNVVRHALVQDAHHLGALRGGGGRPHALRALAHVVVRLGVSKRLRARDFVQHAQHQRHQRARAPVPAPAVNVHPLAPPNPLAHVLGKIDHCGVRYYSAVWDGQLQKVHLGVLVRLAVTFSFLQQSSCIMNVWTGCLTRTPYIIWYINNHLALETHERFNAQLEQQHVQQPVIVNVLKTAWISTCNDLLRYDPVAPRSRTRHITGVSGFDIFLATFFRGSMARRKFVSRACSLHGKSRSRTSTE